jgi:hypothetical protein
VSQLAKRFASKMQVAAIEAKIVVIGMYPAGSCDTDFGTHIRKQYEEYGQVIHDANMRAELTMESLGSIASVQTSRIMSGSAMIGKFEFCHQWHLDAPHASRGDPPSKFSKIERISSFGSMHRVRNVSKNPSQLKLLTSLRGPGAALGPTLCGSIGVSDRWSRKLEPVAQDAAEFDLSLSHIDWLHVPLVSRPTPKEVLIMKPRSFLSMIGV